MSRMDLVMPHQPGAPRTVRDFAGWLLCDLLCVVVIFGGLWAAMRVQP